ncbi:MAG: DNA-directed RNA polymerase subunit alpha, partial [Sphaerochaetaceae bacterium]|nr:DNA-directed RNA polymerase subunit alpha [Sphaerochaetaceae bacterium]
MARKNLLKGFKKPKGITFEHSLVEADSGRFIAYPFERGFGTTVGNTLRRVLLSSIQGYAVTAVKFTSVNEEGIPHLISSEFEPLPGVVEDIPDIIANIKKLKIKMPEDIESVVISVEGKGPGTFTGVKLEKNNIEIINKDLVLFTMTEDADIEMELQIDLARGYVPAEVNEK